MKIVYCLKTKKEIINAMIAPDESYIYIIEGEQNTPKQCNSKFENGEPVLALIGFKVFQTRSLISQFERYCKFIGGKMYDDYAVFDINNQKINVFLNMIKN